MKLIAKYLALKDDVTLGNEYVSRTPLATRQKVWNFWHAVSDESTNTTYLARLHVSEKPKCQIDLGFMSTVTKVIKRNLQFYQSIWKTVSVPMFLLYKKYCEENSDHVVSKGTFDNLKPFYVRNASLKDMEMCCCKLYLHARWSIRALLESAKKLGIAILPEDYKSFFALLSTECDDDDNTYISWKCTQTKKQCMSMQKKNGKR